MAGFLVRRVTRCGTNFLRNWQKLMTESCRRDVRGQPNWNSALLVVVHVIFFRPNGVWRLAMVSNFDPAKARAQRAHTCRRSARRGRTLFGRGYSCRWGSWHTGQSSKSSFSTMTTFHVTVNFWPVSTGIRLLMERKLVVGIRDFCILSSRKACLEGNEKEKLTREVLSVLMVAQKSTRRRVEWIKWGLYTVGFFAWSTPHCTVCPARWLVSSSSVCNPSGDPYVKPYRSPSSFTLCNIFWGISLPKTEQKDHFSSQFQSFKISNSQSDGCAGLRRCMHVHGCLRIKARSRTGENQRVLQWPVRRRSQKERSQPRKLKLRTEKSQPLLLEPTNLLPGQPQPSFPQLHDSAPAPIRRHSILPRKKYCHSKYCTI